MSVNLSPIGGAAAQFFDNNGNPLSGGKLYTYAAGTTTPLASYTTSAGNVPHTNPIILDSAGRVPGGQIWLTDGSVDYKFLLETSFSVLVGTFDNIPPAVSGTAADIVYLPAGNGAVATTVQAKLRESVSVLDFGASPSATAAQNSIALQAALTYASSIGGMLYIPQGEYTYDTGLIYTNNGRGLLIEGASTSNFTAAGGSILKYTGAGNAIVFNGNASTVFIQMRGVTVQGTANALSGIKLNAGWYFKIVDCVVRGFNGTGSSGVYLTYSIGNFVGVTDIIRCNFNLNTQHVYWDVPDVNVVNIDNCRFSDHTYGIFQKAGTASRNVNVTACVFDSTSAFDIASYDGAQNWTITGCYFEQAGALDSPRILITNGGGVINTAITISGNTFSKPIGTAGQTLIYVATCDGLVIENNWSAYPFTNTPVLDRFSVFTTGVTNYRISPFNAVNGATPYPVNINANINYGGYDNAVGGKLYFGSLEFPSIVVASSNANTLDDYEKGTWTPTIEGGSSPGTTTYALRTGRYTKIGRVVQVECEVSWTAATGTGLIALTGFPFFSIEAAPLVLVASNLTFTGQAAFRMFANGAFGYVYAFSSGAAETNPLLSANTSATLRISGSYTTV